MPDIKEEAQSQPAAEASRDVLCTVLDDIRQSSDWRMYITNLKQLESDVQWGQEKAVENAGKKARRDKPITAGRKAHYEQFNFNEWITECLQIVADKITR